jgi:predicted unusual protein kinase regulating ubiquinone biosynthesis (AarF/ABC1/UbiB family)
VQTIELEPPPVRPQRAAGPPGKRPHVVAAPTENYSIDLKRYRKIRSFFIKTSLHIAWWDIILNRPGLRRFRKPFLPRWQQLARDYRALAVEMGGVLIKLGQFLSTRVDLLPPELTDELAGLQDEVPPVPIEQIMAQIDADFGRPVEELFAWFSPEAIGSASLAQVHRARLRSGESVAVKVLRPGILMIVETDLKIIRKFIRRLTYYKPISKYADLDRLAHEFTHVTSKELDLTAEGLNAERFAQDFAQDAQACIPKIYWDYVGPHTLTMEDVSHIKIDDLTALEAAGISRLKVAEKLFDLYMEQILVTHFVHADPHAGNLFIKPLPHPDEILSPQERSEVFRPGETVPFYPDRPFQIAFVDFGMAVSIPKRLWGSLRDYVVGIGTQDARLIVESYLDAGVLLYDADLKQVEEMTEELLERFSGSFLGQMKGIDLTEYARFYEEYKALLYSSPFQFQADLLFVMRALGILSGITSEIAADFNPTNKIGPLAERLMRQELQPTMASAMKAIPRLLKMPRSLEDVLLRAQRGQLSFQTEFSASAQKSIRRLRGSVDGLTFALLAVGLFVAGVIWHTGKSIVAVISPGAGSSDSIGIALMVLGAIIFLLGILKRRRE